MFLEENVMKKLLTVVAVLLLSVGFVGTASAIPAGALLWVIEFRKSNAREMPIYRA